MNYELKIKELEEQIKDLKEQTKNLFRMGRNRKMNVLLSYDTLTWCQFLLEGEIKSQVKIFGETDVAKLSEDNESYLVKRAMSEINKAVEGFD